MTFIPTTLEEWEFPLGKFSGERLAESGCFLAYNHLHSKGIIPQNASSLRSVVVKEVRNKQTHRLTDIILLWRIDL